MASSSKRSKNKATKPTPKTKAIAKSAKRLEKQESYRKDCESETECHLLIDPIEKPKF